MPSTMCRYNWGKGSDAYTKGDGYAQIAISTEVSCLKHALDCLSCQIS